MSEKAEPTIREGKKIGLRYRKYGPLESPGDDPTPTMSWIDIEAHTRFVNNLRALRDRFSPTH